MKKEWDLSSHFYQNKEDPKIQSDVDFYVKSVELFIKKYGNIHKSDFSLSEFISFINDYDNLGTAIEKPYTYLSLSSALDTQDQFLQKRMQDIGSIYAQCSEKLTFTFEYFKSLGFDKLIDLSEEEDLLPFKNYIISIADSIKYILSEESEKLFIKFNESSDSNMREELCSSFEFDFRGEIMNESQVRALRSDPDRLKRLDAFRSIAKVYSTKQNQIVLGHLYSLVCKGKILQKETRGYDNIMSSRNISEEMDDKVVDNLMKNVYSSYSLYHEFLSQKNKLLGLGNDFSIHDVFAPIESDESKEVSFEEGWKIYSDVFKDVDPLMYEFSKSMLESGRISVYPYKGKVGGAFASYTKDLPEFNLLNWTNKIDDISTLAHEQGHCFHGMLSKKQKRSVYHTPLSLAETASIFNETLMFENLLSKETDSQKKISMIVNRLDDIFSTVFRQVAYVRFEKECHQSFADKKSLTYEDYNSLFLKETSDLYGPSVKIDPKLAEFGWSSIPHIYGSPFYCYAYAFGNIISLNLVENYKKSPNKKEFIDKYHEFLSSGGSKRPEDLLWDVFQLKIDDNFYQVAFDNIRSLLSILKISQEEVKNIQIFDILTSNQLKKFKKWEKSKKKLPPSAIGGAFEFKIIPTSVGEVIKVECVDGTSIDLTEYDHW